MCVTLHAGWSFMSPLDNFKVIPKNNMFWVITVEEHSQSYWNSSFISWDYSTGEPILDQHAFKYAYNLAHGVPKKAV